VVVRGSTAAGAADATLVVGVTGNGAIVTVTPGGECETSQNGGGTCSFQVPAGSTVTLARNEDSESDLVAWSVPECPGAGSCSIVMNAPVRGVVASFSPTLLSVITSNDGNVRSSESPPAIDCGDDGDTCEADYPAFSHVTLTAASTGAFKGWSGACEDAGTARTCSLDLSGDDVVGAWFDGPDDPPEIIPPRLEVPVEVRKSGGGDGTVTSERSRLSEAINCGSGAGCVARFRQGEKARLSAQAAAGSEFTGWKSPSGLCGVERTCSFPVTRVSRLEAVFVKSRQQPCSNRKVGGQRADRLDGGPGGDALYGRAGNDRIRGFGGADCLLGERGSDLVQGGSGADTVSGGPGDDALDGGSGPDVIEGGRGRDRILAVDGSRDTVSCGPGRDSVRADRVDRVTGCERRLR
jgi:RTX calcium-binding nonapeptide repeat (4 copies)/Divergent InlB B-repeat domain